MEFEAKLLFALPVQSGTSKAGKPWSKAEIVVETLGQYPKKIKLSNMKNAEAFSTLPPNTIFNFFVDIESREFNGRWYTEVNCYNWKQSGGQAPVAQTPPQPQSATPTLDSMGVQGYQPKNQTPPQEDDQLPF